VERRRTTPGRDPYPAASPSLVSLGLALALLRTKQRALKAGIIVFGRRLWHTGRETLDAALNALESLRLSGRTIGVISHIDQFTRCIPVRIDMKRTGAESSTVHVKG